MNTRIYKALAAAAILTVVSCVPKFQDENNAHYEQLLEDNTLVGSLFQQMERSVIFYRDGQYLDSDYQIMYNLCSETWAGYLAPTLGDGHNNSGFQINDGWTRSMFVNKYAYCMGAFNDFKAIAEENQFDTQLAMGTIVKVASMHMVTDYYGPIAYTSTGSLSNTYDKQETVYKTMLRELDESIATLEESANGGMTTIMDESDIVYAGDIVKWIKFANSLRLRLAMRIVYADESLAKTEAEKSLASSYGVITSNDDNAVVSGVDHHPLYEINVNFNDADTQIGASLDCYLNGYNDPRKFLYAIAANDGQLHGVRPGITVSNWDPYKNKANNVSAPRARNFDIVWLNAAEVAFLRAEGAVRGWNMGGAAKALYEDGIRLSFEQWGASGVSAYLTSTATPAAFKDVVGSASVTTAPSTVTPAWSESASLEGKLEKIGTQKWLALFPNGPEAWAEYRRLHYPKLLTPANNYSNGTVNTDQQIRRATYPISEQTDNRQGYDAGVAALRAEGGTAGDTAGSRLWWDKKPF